MLPKALQDLIDDLSSLPGIGPKSATRLALHLLESPDYLVENVVDHLQTLKQRIKYCTVCNNFTEEAICRICANEERDQKTILVVASALDVIAIEESDYRGLYHVLGGVISPLQGITPESLTFEKLFTRLKQISELIIALPTSLEGESTATYLRNAVTRTAAHVEIYQIARGLPTNSSIEYQDSQTLQNALAHKIRL